MKKQATLLIVGMLAVGGASGEVVSNLLQDAGFEVLDGIWPGNEPNTDTFPWFTTGEDATGSLVAKTEYYRNGEQSFCFSWYGDSGAVVQNTGVQVETNLNYEASAWMLIAEQSGNANHTNTPLLTISVYTSPTVDGTYAYRKGFFFNQTVSAEETWQELSGTLTGEELAPWQGEYMQIRFVKPSAGTPSSHRIYLDDVEFGEYLPEPPAPGIVLGFYQSFGPHPDYSIAGVDGALFGASFDGGVLDTSAGSIDGTYGTLPGASALSTAYKVREGNTNANRRVGVQLINNTGGPLKLGSISFDYGRWSENSPKDIMLSYAYGALDVVDGTEIYTATNLAVTGVFGDYHDFNVSLTNLNDVVLAYGERATFHLSVDNAGGIWDKGAFDNIAILGTTLADGWFVDSEQPASDQMQLTIHTSGDLSEFVLLECNDLMNGSWSYAAHSDDGISPYIVTNLSHSTSDTNGNVVIYVDATDARRFFGLQF